MSRRRGITHRTETFLAALPIDIVPVLPDDARRAGAAYDRWGKGVHPAGLNFGDCFAYALAEAESCPLLFVGQDFAQTEIRSALA